MLVAVTRGLRAHGAIWPHVVQADRHEVSVGLVRAGGSIQTNIFGERRLYWQRIYGGGSSL